VDAEIILGNATARGLVPVENPADADVLIVNTCGFIEPAKKESIDTIFQLSRFKQIGRCQRLVVTGCLAQRYAEQLASQIPEIDFLLGTGDVLHVADAIVGQGPRLRVGSPQGFLSTASTPRMLSKVGSSAYIKIADGCTRQCAFCAIPRIKGPHRSRSVEDIVQEAENLVSQGVIEINLVAQDTLRFGHDLSSTSSLATLVQRLANVPGLHWVRLLYLYPDELDDALLELIAHHPHVAPYIDMPMQHAADPVLKTMRRGHGQRRLRAIVERIRKRAPHASLRSAFIVGFPGETKEDFDQLVSFVQWARFDHLGVFRYSDEEDTAAFDLPDKVPPRESYRRFRKLMSVQRPIARANNRQKKGQILQVLVEGPSEEHEWVFAGRHAGQAPDIDGHVLFSESDVQPGEIWSAEVLTSSDYDLVVRIQGDTPIAKARLKKILPVLPSR
jgi:ribosomal protein S12 methylthiotransferase